MSSVEQQRAGRLVRIHEPYATEVVKFADRELEGNFSMAVRKLVSEALTARGLVAPTHHTQPRDLT